MASESHHDVIALLDEAIELQQRKVHEIAARLSPNATSEDLLNPHDIAALTTNSHFNYEDGYLNGLQASRIAILTLSKS